MMTRNDARRPLRVAYVIDKLSLHGTQKFLVCLAQGLARRGIEQKVYCLKNDAHPAHRDALRAAGVELIIVGRLNIILLRGVWRMIAAWRAWRPDIVFTLLFNSDQLGRVAAKLAGVPVILSSIRAKNVYKRRWQLLLDRLTARWADTVIFNTRGAIPFALQYEGVRPEQVAYIPNGVAMPPPMRDRREVRQRFGLPEHARVIGTVGRVSHQKGHAFLLHAFREIHAQFPDTLLLIAGQGPLFAPMRALARELGLTDCVRFLGERTDIDALLACLDVYAQASLFEGMPNALMEAMAAGKPVIATAVDGSCELVEDGKTGWLIPPENAAMLADALRRALLHPAQAAEVGRAAAAHVTAAFSVEKMVEAYEDLFRASRMSP